MPRKVTIPQHLVWRARTALQALGYLLDQSMNWCSGDLVSDNKNFFSIAAGGVRGNSQNGFEVLYIVASTIIETRGCSRLEVVDDIKLSVGTTVDEWVVGPEYFEGTILGMDINAVELQLRISEVWYDDDSASWMYGLSDMSSAMVTEDVLKGMVSRIVKSA